MYLPAAFREHKLASLHDLMRAHPLGLLVTHGPGGLQASPMPFLLDADGSGNGTLRAHLARANPHWRDLDKVGECLVVFQGADGYVSPSWYASKAVTGKVVPTWNYATVHAWGKPMVTENAAWLERQVKDMTALHEGARLQPWALSDAPGDYIAAQLKAIVGIEIPISRLEGKWKMSQNRDVADRQGVIAGLCSDSDAHHDSELAQVVERCLRG